MGVCRIPQCLVVDLVDLVDLAMPKLTDAMNQARHHEICSFVRDITKHSQKKYVRGHLQAQFVFGVVRNTVNH